MNPRHARHLLAASARLWNPWTDQDLGQATVASAPWTDRTVDANLAMIVGRLLSPWNATARRDRDPLL